MKVGFINELGNQIRVAAKLRQDGLVVWALWSKRSTHSGVITQLEARTLAYALTQCLPPTEHSPNPPPPAAIAP